MSTEIPFADLIAPVKHRMFETVWRILRHPQDAEDALQNALTIIWRQRARIAGHRVPQALILKICADAAIDQFRRRRSVKHTGVPLEESMASAEPSPLGQAIEREHQEILLASIAKLSPNQAASIVMRHLQGESLADIAAALGCGIETVREHLDRGKKRLDQLVGYLAAPRPPGIAVLGVAPLGTPLSAREKTQTPKENER